MKRLTLVAVLALVCLLLLGSVACAERLYTAPYNVDFYQKTGLIGHDCTVLCNSLSVRVAPSDSASRKKTLTCGNMFVSTTIQGNYMDCYLDNDYSVQYWVRREYVLEYPSFVILESGMPVYAYANNYAPRVGYLDKGDKMAIIAELNGWYCLSLRGASTWLPVKNAPVGFDLNDLYNAVSAELTVDIGFGQTQTFILNDYYQLNQLKNMLTKAVLHTSVQVADFNATLSFIMIDDKRVDLLLSTDGSCLFRINGREYAYADSGNANPGTGEGPILPSIFGTPYGG